MAALVIKSWRASDAAFDDKGTLILIEGREGGLIAWFLALIGFDPVTTLRITQDRIDLDKRSWSGTEGKMMPLESVDYIFHGYHKPWKQALALFLAWIFLVANLMHLISMLLGLRGDLFAIIAYVTAVPVAVIYYLLARSFRLGMCGASGDKIDIHFKRSVIGNQEINAKEAAYVCEMADYLRDCRRQRLAG